ncbi:MAG: type II toxin-antitoxin system RelE/ParE family toxin [Verrucomicrobiota bacterium]
MKQHVPRIIEAVELLADDPRPDGCTKLTGSERAYRIRVGNYRVIYEVFDDTVLIEVVRVGHRRDVYR